MCVRVDVQDATFLTFSLFYLATFFWKQERMGRPRQDGRRDGRMGLTFACAVRRRSEEMKRQKEGTTSYGFVA